MQHRWMKVQAKGVYPAPFQWRSGSGYYTLHRSVEIRVRMLHCTVHFGYTRPCNLHRKIILHYMDAGFQHYYKWQVQQWKVSQTKDCYHTPWNPALNESKLWIPFCRIIYTGWFRRTTTCNYSGSFFADQHLMQICFHHVLFVTYIM